MNLVTGATGLLGSHIAEQLRLRDKPVRAIVRPGSDDSFLKSIGVEVVPGDITDRSSLDEACKGVENVYHSAARVGDWGPWEDFVRVSINGTQNVIDAAAKAQIRRLLHISSISVYGHVNIKGKVYDESAPLGQCLYKWAYYSRAKVEAEKLLWKAHEEKKIVASVIRPSWIYGPRDRATMGRLINAIRARKAKLVGPGDNRLNVTHAANIAEGCILAAESEKGAGEAYNVCHDGVMTQKQYYNRIAEAIGEPPVSKSVPYNVVKTAAFFMECFGHLFRTKNPPLVTRYSAWLLGRHCFFECNKIKEQLGWKSTISYEDGIPAAVKDYLESHK